MLILFSLIIILFSAIIHEYMHGWMADRLGDHTARNAGRLTINPIPHIDLWGSIVIPAIIYFSTAGAFIFGYAKPVPFNPYNLRDQKYGGAKIAIAGPLANLAMAIAFGMVLRFMPVANDTLITLLASVVQINIILMVFNLVPIPPLDGSKVLAPFLPSRLQDKYEELEKYGFLLVLVFLMVGFTLISPVVNFLFRVIVGGF